MLINLAVIADGVLVNAIGALAGMVMRPHMSQRTAADLDTAGWADTEMLIKHTPSDVRLRLPALADDEVRSLEATLRTDEVQAALQALLAARLTDAPGTEATRAREAVSAAITGPHSEWLSEYYDDKICTLVGRLEGSLGFVGLGQVRNEAYNSRIVALLRTITDMLAALQHPDRGGSAENDFLDRYARQVRERHGKLQPPDFERRRRIAVDKIYVNTDVYPHPEFGADDDHAPMKVMDLAEHLDRTVLLGDPGGGKTTAANVLANHFADNPGQRIPFVVTLREYAAADPPERSVAGHIEHVLETLYQCQAPDGLVERLLLTSWLRRS